MQFRITKTITAVAFVLASVSVQAQIKISKVTNGTRTAVKNGDKVDIHLSKTDETVLDNVVVDLDIAAFKKAYKFDRVAIVYTLNNYEVEYYGHTFDSPLNTKKYAGKGIIPVYAYDTKNFKETDFRTLVKGSVNYSGSRTDVRKVIVYGSYKTGEEGYFDNNDIYKTRDVFSPGEVLASVDLNVIFDEERMLDYDYNRVMNNDLENMSDKFERNIVGNVTQYVAPYVATPLYGALAEGFREVWKSKVDALKAETDKQKAINSVKQLSADYETMYKASQKDKAVLKTMNKDIKTKTTVEEKWELIKANA